MVVFYLLVVLACAASLPRCGSGLGQGYAANANGMKF
jgi:hypothetical protein